MYGVLIKIGNELGSWREGDKYGSVFGDSFFVSGVMFGGMIFNYEWR